jgi:formate dehydrogenase maturation protein FdhE
MIKTNVNENVLFKLYKFEEDKFYKNNLSDLETEYFEEKRISQRIKMDYFKFNSSGENLNSIKQNYLNQVNNELLCPLCASLLVLPVIASCGHTFCRVCVYEYLIISYYCLICNDNIKMEKFMTSFMLTDLTIIRGLKSMFYI